MSRYMVVYCVDGKTCARFSDVLADVENTRFACACGCGGEAEIYERTEGECGWEYTLLYA